MPVTVSLIESKDFKFKSRGYDPVEVDAFLDDICDEMVRMDEEIKSLQTRVLQAARTQAYMPAPAAPAPARAAAPDNSEAMQKMLANTQRVCDESIAQAKLQAAEIIASAKAQVPDPQIASLTETRDSLLSEIDLLRESAKTFRERFLKFIDDQRKAINEEQDLF
jgi:DivIVA domain-containing protein